MKILRSDFDIRALNWWPTVREFNIFSENGKHKFSETSFFFFQIGTGIWKCPFLIEFF